MVDFNPQDYMAMMQNNTAAANAFNAAQSQQQMDFQVAQNARAMDFNHREAELNRNWQKMMSDTAHQREVQDLISAGLNPVLSALGGNGASVGSGSAASISSPQGSRAEADTSINASMAGLLSTMISGQTQRDVANINAAAAMHNAELSADAQKYSANTSYAGLLQQLAHQEEWPTTLFGMLSAGLHGFGESFSSLASALKDFRLPEFNINLPGITSSGSGSSSSSKGLFDFSGNSLFDYNPEKNVVSNIVKKLIDDFKARQSKNTSNKDYAFSRYYHVN